MNRRALAAVILTGAIGCGGPQGRGPARPHEWHTWTDSEGSVSVRVPMARPADEPPIKGGGTIFADDLPGAVGNVWVQRYPNIGTKPSRIDPGRMETPEDDLALAQEQSRRFGTPASRTVSAGGMTGWEVRMRWTRGRHRGELQITRMLYDKERHLALGVSLWVREGAPEDAPDIATITDSAILLK